jgi:precorrin-8X/cobalt-precorrin-8 methylmutase
MIEQESFRIIEEELRQRWPEALPFPPGQFEVVRRMIHATGDMEFAELVRFGPGAVEAGISALRAGKSVLVDVNMAAQGISKGLLEGLGGRILCNISSPEAAALARDSGITRAEAGIELAAGREDIGIVAIGNAPTALIHLVRMVMEGRFEPDLIVGVPVGFVNAAESKEFLEGLDRPWITTRGRKGGTPAAVAAVNALIRLATKEGRGS